MSANTRDYVARTERGQKSQKYLADLLHTLTADPKDLPKDVAEDVLEMNGRLRRLAERKRGDVSPELVARELSVGDVQTTPVLQNFSQMYTNDEYIGTRIMPYVDVPFGTGSATYWTLDQNNRFGAPDDTIGTLGTPSDITEHATATSVTLAGHALRERIDVRTKAAMDAPVAQLINPLLAVLDGLALNEERRIAAIAGVVGSFGANNAAILAADRWNTAAGGDPGGAVDTAKSALFGGNGPTRTIAACSDAVYNALRRNPVVLDQFKYTGNQTVSREQLASFFEVDELLVGRARQNTALEGVADVYARIWPNVFGVYRVPAVPSVRSACFGITIAEPKQETEWFDPNPGTAGAFCTKVAFASTSVVIAPLCGYLITTPI